MQYILSEEEYNALQSRIHSLETTNKELRRDLEGTERELQFMRDTLVAIKAFRRKITPDF